MKIDQLKMQYNTDADLARRGVGRASQLARRLGVEEHALGGASILEVGCGYGEQCAALEDIFGAKVVGIDPWPRSYSGPYRNRTFYKQADVTADSVRELGRFDFVCSYDVMEHIEAPRRALENIFELLKPGGRAYLKYNLHRGASASHLMKYLNFPWIHLIHDEQTIRGMMKDKVGYEKGPAWVNRLTYAHYLHYLDEIGFMRLKTWYDIVSVPKDFMDEHRKKLKAYPKEDLERNFMHVVLERPKEK